MAKILILLAALAVLYGCGDFTATEQYLSEGGSGGSDGGSSSTSTGSGGEAGSATTGGSGGGESGGPPCGVTSTGAIDYGSEGPSCAGQLTCQTASCCESNLVAGEGFSMGRGNEGCDVYPTGDDDEQPEHPAALGGYYLDRFEVTVGRFRSYVNQYDGTGPIPGAAAHPSIPDSGWQSEWDAHLPPSQAALRTALDCHAEYATWSDAPGVNEAAAINCVSWYLAFAFCAWDEGRLPTEAEWEMAAAGGDDNRFYPWGYLGPGTEHANFKGEGASPFIDVGSYPHGAARWGHDDLGGGMWEWVLDQYDEGWYENGGSVCTNCANLITGETRVARGGSWGFAKRAMRAVNRRGDYEPGFRHQGVGFRCVRL